jgi:hypothetical protein
MEAGKAKISLAPKHYNAIFHEWVGISGVTCNQTEEVD